MSVQCPKCRKTLDSTGYVPGASIVCGSCGNTTFVPARRGSNKGLFIGLAIGAAVLMVPCIGIMAAIAIPNFIRFQGRSKQMECKVNLKAWFTGQRYSTDEGGLSARVDRVGFAPERGNRYAYFAGSGPIEDRGSADARHGEDAVGFGVDTFRHQGARAITFKQLPPEVARGVGISGECPEGPDCGITMVCAGDLDRDDTLDVWSISTVDRVDASGEQWRAGEPIQHVNDLTD